MPTGVYPRGLRGPYKLRSIEIVIGPSIALVTLTQGQFSLIDADDAERVGKSNWHAYWNSCTKSYYAYRELPRLLKKGRSSQSLHEFITGCDAGISDHIHPSRTLDNRKANLRIADRYQNMQNRRKFSNNTSGFKGVYPHKQMGKWVAQLKVSKKTIYLGYYDTPEEANQVVSKARAEHHGNFARTE